ncbi:MAG: TatD family hydrolase [Desulfurococcaceae archaeon]
MYVDGHAHCHELGRQELEELARGGFVVVCVSDDVESSRATMALAESAGVVPCIGIHPWSVGRLGPTDARNLIRELGERASCLGEVGLDSKFVPQTIELQREVFAIFLEASRELGLPMNLHAAGTWREVFELVRRADVDRAYFHWYTGPADLLDEIVGAGYFVGANAALKVQAKHRELLARAPLGSVISESDAPYNYRGLELRPRMVAEVVEFLASTRGLSAEVVATKIRDNAKRLYGGKGGRA